MNFATLPPAVCSAVLAAVSVTGASAATYTTYSDRTAFEAAAGPVTTNDLESVPAGSGYDGISLDLGDFSVFADANGNPARNKVDDGFRTPETPSYNGTQTADFFLNNSSGSLTFAAPIYSIGFDIAFFGNGAASVSKVTILGFDFLGDLLGNEQIFFGLLSDTPFTTIGFSATANDGFQIDNISYGGAPAVPLPAGLPLIATALAGLVLVRRRRR